MNLQKLYKEIYGTNITPSDEQLKQLGVMMTTLPDNIFNAVFQHYARHRSIDEIAQASGEPVHLVKRWLNSGISLLKVFAGAETNANTAKPS